MDLDMKVLVVDDFASMRRIIKGVIKQMGFTKIIEADDGSVALQVLKKEEIGLVLCDWNMPRMAGIELLKAVKNDEDLKDIPFILTLKTWSSGPGQS